jgi:Holliday junction resolvase YEN1
MKQGREWRSCTNESIVLLQHTLDILGIASHTAVGEAEADCAEMQKRGIVDAVWTEDGDTFMFGASTVIRFYYKRENTKSKTHFRLFRYQDIVNRVSGLDREGFVLYSILSGGDYDKDGLKNIGTEGSLKAAKRGLGKSLCQASESDLAAWRQELIDYLKEIRSSIVVPSDFPKFQHVRDYRQPLISDFRTFEWKKRPVIEAELKLFLQKYFNIQAEQYVKWVVPALLVRNLMQTTSGQEYINRSYELEIGKQAKQNVFTTKITYLLSATTALDMGDYPKKDCSIFPSQFRAECDIPSWVLQQAVPEVFAALAAGNPGNSSEVTKPGVSKISPAQFPTRSADTNKETSSTGKKRGRPRKDTHVDTITQPALELSNKRPRVLESFNTIAQPPSINKPAKPSSTISHIKRPKIPKPSVTGQKEDPVDLVSSDDELETSKPVFKRPRLICDDFDDSAWD